jgi:hypothetical protein
MSKTGEPTGFLSGKEYRRIPLARCVMVVAVFDRQIGDWAAYVDTIPGDDHSKEWGAVVDHGMKISKALAAVLFPSLAEDKGLRWRD